MKKIIVAAVEENLHDDELEFENLDEFAEKTLTDVIVKMFEESMIIDFNQLKDTRDELKDEITDITRKKMYGHHDIRSYRDSNKTNRKK